MALNDFKPQFDNAYQEIFQKTLVAKEVMNTRFESVLTFGASVARISYDISSVLVRTVTRGNASIIDSISDTPETLIINLEKEAVFHVSDGESTQAGPLNPGTVIGKQIGRKISLDLDGRCFAEVRNAAFAFDNGDLLTGTSTGIVAGQSAPITLSATTVPQLVTRMPAKLRARNNQEIMTSMIFVLDSYAAADLTQYIMGKNIDLAGNVFKNGYTGDVSNAMLYVSENLQGEATLLSTGVFADGEIVNINGVVFTAKTVLGGVAGQFLIGAAATNSIQNLAGLINAPSVTNATGVALSAVDQSTIGSFVATATSATVLTIVGTGTGRLILSKTATNWTWSTNFIHAYFGKRGAIDLVIQDMKMVDMRVTPDRRGTNVFSSYLAGIKTFLDGTKKFLDVKILVA